MYSQSKNNEKTAEELVENIGAAVGSLASVGIISIANNIVDIDPQTGVAITATVSTGVMALLKTIIRRVRNRIKHKRAERRANGRP